MTSLSHTTGYAIEALACLARRGPDSVRVGEIAESTGIPSPYLAKIFQRLGEAGIIESKRGYKGGVRLLCPPSEISLLDIDAAVESAKPAEPCAVQEKSPRPNTFWEAFHKSYRDKLASMTLADVLNYESPPATAKR